MRSSRVSLFFRYSRRVPRLSILKFLLSCETQAGPGVEPCSQRVIHTVRRQVYRRCFPPAGRGRASCERPTLRACSDELATRRRVEQWRIAPCRELPRAEIAPARVIVSRSGESFGRSPESFFLQSPAGRGVSQKEQQYTAVTSFRQRAPDSHERRANITYSQPWRLTSQLVHWPRRHRTTS